MAVEDKDEDGGGSRYTIGEISRLLDVSPRTIRYYEEIGLLDRPRRQHGLRRVYGGTDLARLRFIGRLKLLGLTLADMRELNRVYRINRSNHTMLERCFELLERHRQHIGERIRQLAHLQGQIEEYQRHIRTRIDTGSDQ